MNRDVRLVFALLAVAALYASGSGHGAPLWDNPPPQGYTLSGVTWSGTQYVAVGNGGTILYSHDAATWLPAATGTRMWLHAVDWNGRRFIAVGKAGVVLTSPDGVLWALHDTGNPALYLHGVAHNERISVAVGSGGVVLTSTDGDDWSKWNVGVNEWLNAVAWNGTEFVAVGSRGLIVASTDGMHWVQRNSPVRTEHPDDTVTGPSLEGIAWGAGRWVAVSSAMPNQVLTSTDGITWRAVASTAAGQNLYAITWDGTQQRFVAAGIVGGVVTGAVAADGEIVWTRVATGWPQYLRAVTRSAAGYLVAGQHGLILESDAAAANWQRRTTAPSPLVSMHAVATDGIGYVAVGDGLIVARPNAVTGPSLITRIGEQSVPLLRGVVSGPDGYTAIDRHGAVLRSANGTAWTLDASAANGALDLNDVARTSDGTLYAVDSNGTVLRREAESAWQALNSDRAPAPLYAIAPDDAGLIAVGGDGLVLVSEDRTAWTLSTATPGVALRGVATGDNRRVAVGAHGTFATYVDGAWTTGNVGTASDLFDVAWNGSSFTAVGDNGAIFDSNDGIHWTSQSEIVGNRLLGVAVSARGSVMVGEGGTVIYNGCPCAYDDYGTTTRGTPLTIAVLANDVGDNLMLRDTDATSLRGGTVVRNSDGTLTYTPPSAFVGSDSFSYTLGSTTDPEVAMAARVTVSVDPRSSSGANDNGSQPDAGTGSNGGSGGGGSAAALLYLLLAAGARRRHSRWKRPDRLSRSWHRVYPQGEGFKPPDSR